MTARPFLIATLGSLLLSAPATAERRRAARDDDSRRGIGKVSRDDRKRAAIDEEDEDDRPAKRSKQAKTAERDARAARDARAGRRAADLEELEDSDGPEARAVLPIKLRDLIEVAVRLSPELTMSKEDRKAAKGNAAAARRDQAWVLGLEANYSVNAIGREIEVSPFQSVRDDQLKAALTLGRKLPTGGFLGVELGVTRSATEVAIPQELVDQFQQGDPVDENQLIENFTRAQTIAKVAVTQPLARGFGPDVAKAQEKRADLQLSEATIRTQLAAEEMIASVVSGYWELALLAYTVDVRNEAVVLAEAHEKATREEIRVGSAAATALNAVTFEIATRKEALLTAQLEFEKKSLELRRKIGLELSKRQIALRPAEAFEIGADEWDVEEVLARSRRANRHLLALGIQRKIAEIDVNVAKNGMLPQIDVNLSAGLVGNAGNNQPIDVALSNLGAFSGYQVMAGVKVEFELSGAARGAHEAAQARRARTEVERVDRARTLDAEVVASVKEVTAARARVALQDKAIFVAEENVKVERQSFLAARSDNFRVMERQTQLIDARLRRGRAVTDYHVAVAKLQQLSGVLLEQYRVDVRPRSGR